jgi:hypothetical protein
MAIVAIVVAAIAFAAGLGAEAAFRSSSSSTSPASPALTYSQAGALANALARSVGGVWEENVSAGFDSPQAGFFPATGDYACPFPGFYIPRYTGSASAGAAPVWLFEFYESPSAVAPGLLAVLVENGSASVLVHYPEATICTTSDHDGQVVTGPVADSPAVAENATSSGGGSFLLAEPTSFVVFELAAGSPPSWTVAYNPCGLFVGRSPLSGPQTTLGITLSGSDGAFESSEDGSTVCVSSTPYLIGLSASGSPGTLANGASYDNLSVTINADLPLGNLAAYIETSTGTEVYPSDTGCLQPSLGACPEPSYGWYLVVSLGGTIQESYAGSPPTNSWFPYTTGLLSYLETGETVTIVSNGALSGSGDTFALLGTGGAVASGTITL